MLITEAGKLLQSYIDRYDGKISAAGIRYGSVAYIGFGLAFIRTHKQHLDTTHYPIEIEMGTDYWRISKDDAILLESNFTKVDDARKKISNILVDKVVKRIDFGRVITIETSDGILIDMEISENPSSGFSLSVDVDGELSWETIDGLSVT
jgi:hypothetical protein